MPSLQQDDSRTDTAVAPWTERLWSQVTDVHAAILDHPFLQGLREGSLPEERFRHYVAQDSHYLREYARALAAVAAKAPTHQDAAVFGGHAAGTYAVEHQLHETLLPELGLGLDDLAGVPVTPTTTAYCSHLQAVAGLGSYAEGVAAVLPCFWVYQRVGEALVADGSPDPRYQRWIDTYAGEEFASSVREVLELTDRVGADLGEAEAARAEAHFVTSTRYEWMFWDAAWREETWPV